MSPTVVSTALALPAHSHSQQRIAAEVAGLLAGHPQTAARATALMANAGVRRRHTVRPLEWYAAHPSVTERSTVYGSEMVALCERAAGEALQKAGIPPAAVGMIVSTSCTGLMIPAVESHLVNRMGFSPNVRRLPITELGCAAGAAALALADTHLLARRDEAVLILAAELPSLTAQLDDFSIANIVSAALFGDGAAAALVVGDRFSGPSPPPATGASHTAEQRPCGRIVATRSVLFPDTLNMMGFDNTDSGLRIFLSPQVPRFLRRELPSHVLPFLSDHGLELEEVAHFLLHPGGPKVIEGLEGAFGLSREQTRFSRRVLADYGNLSSATVLFLLHQFQTEAVPRAGDFGLLMAVGPGFCAEMILLQW
ncbi:MAG: 3-oxoacyl-[acyl-carrier-protein] synthase III C-terminal domain-containing protein [bacterium]